MKTDRSTDSEFLGSASERLQDEEKELPSDSSLDPNLDPSMITPAPHSLAFDGGLPPEPEDSSPATEVLGEEDAARGENPESELASRASDATAGIAQSTPSEGVSPGDTSVTMHRIVAHDRLAHQSRIVLRLGQMLLASGASAFRCKNSMARLARAVGVEQHHAQVTYTEIIATAYASGTFRTELAEQRAMGVNADKIDLLSNYVDGLEGKQVLVEDVDRDLDKIEQVPALYGWFGNALASGVACAGFSFLNHGGWVECSFVAIAAFFGQFLRRQMLHRRMNHFGAWMASGAAAATIYIALILIAQNYFGLESTHQAGLISAVLFLVPGFPLVTGIIDLVRQDFPAGIARLTYVSMLVVSGGCALWAVTMAFHWSVTPQIEYDLTPLALYLLRFGASFIASFGFAMLFNSPPKVCAAGAAIGAIINTGRLALVDELGLAAPAAAAIAAICAGLLATAVARKTHFSRVTLSVPAVVIMIPGVPLYRSLAYLNAGQVNDSVASLFTVLFTIVAIGVGLAVSRMLTDRNWLVETPQGIPSLGSSTYGQRPRR